MNQDPLLVADIYGCRSCRLGEIRVVGGFLPTPALPGPRYRSGGLAILCEAPGSDEERAGQPLVGSAGKLFTKLVQRAGLNRDDLLLVNRIRCRPPNNRIKDWPEAVAACDPWTAKELRTYNPAVVVTMGGTAMSAIFGMQAKVTSTRGTFAAKDDRHEWGQRVYVASYHPAAAIYGGGADSEVAQHIVNDLKAAKQMIEELPYWIMAPRLA